MNLKHAWMCVIGGVAFVLSQANGQTNTFPSTGNVGIGTTSPAAKLDVEGGGIAVGSIPPLSANSALIGASTDGHWIGLYPSLASSSWNGIVQTGDHGLIYSDGGKGTGAFVIAPWIDGYSGLRMDGSGNVGIGVAAPSQKLSIANGSLTLDKFAYISSLRTGLNGYTNAFLGGGLVDNGDGTYTVSTDGGSNYFGAVRMDAQGGNAGAISFYTGPSTGGFSYPISNSQLGNYQRMTIVGRNVGIGTATPGAMLEVNGNLKLSTGAGAAITFSDATVQSTAWTGVLSGGDYAESVDITAGRDSISPGDLVVINAERNGQFLKSTEAYSTLISGVYATKPGVTGRRQPKDKSSDDEVPMAMIGIVPTKVSTENGPIHRGDLLVSAGTPGYAMKGTDHSRMMGAVIGKALAPLETGSGVIEVLISLQ